MPASASHFKRSAYAFIVALAMLPISGTKAADPVFLPEIAPSSAFPDARHATRREGIFVPPASLRLLVPGITKRQVYALVGVPHFHEGFFGEHEWDYILNFYTGVGTAYRICRLQLRWDRGMRLENLAWDAEACRAAVYPVAEKVEAIPSPPDPGPRVQPLSVYFDFDKADLGEAALRDLAALAASVAGSSRSLSVVGYTDSAGPDAHNDRLSLMRADAVAEKLISLGLPPATIQISGAGERSPALDKGIDRAEPLNRRVVISVTSQN